jgi:hypothetical protein
VKLPEDYWALLERDPAAASGTAAERLARMRADIDGTGALITSEQPHRVLVWRGQSDADYGLSSSLFRTALLVHSMSELSERRLFSLEEEIIKYARDCGLGRGMNNLELLHAMQHYALPTRLIDVSRDSESALWFASNDRPRKDGRLFLFAVPAQAVRQNDPKLRMLPWAGIALGSWTNRVLLLDAPSSNPRMAAQNGAFLVGGLARNYAGQQRLMKDKRGNWRYVPSEQIHEISEVFVKFPQQLTPKRVSKWNDAETYGVSWRVPCDLKSTLLTDLGSAGIRAETMYPDFDAAQTGLALKIALTGP